MVEDMIKVWMDGKVVWERTQPGMFNTETAHSREGKKGFFKEFFDDRCKCDKEVHRQ